MCPVKSGCDVGGIMGIAPLRFRRSRHAERSRGICPACSHGASWIVAKGFARPRGALGPESGATWPR
jgi:hypothetical protein